MLKHQGYYHNRNLVVKPTSHCEKKIKISSFLAKNEEPMRIEIL